MANAKGIRAGRAFVELGVSDKLSAGLRRAQRRLRAFGEGVRAIGTRLVVAGAAAVASLGAAVRVFSKSGDALEKMSRRTGLSVESLSELGFAAEQSGADMETLEKGVRTMQRAIYDLGRGLSTQVDAFNALGLSMADLQGLSPEQQFKLIATRLSQVTDATKRAAIAQQIFGRAGTRLLPLMESGAAGMEMLQEQARRLGLTISTQDAKAAASLTDTLNILRRVVMRAAFAVGAALASSVESLAKRVTRIVVTTTAWLKQHRELIVTTAKVAIAVAGIGAVLVTLGVALAIIGAAFGGLAVVVGAVGSVFGAVGAAIGALLTPLGLVVAAVLAAGVAFLRFSGIGAAALEFLRDKWATLSDIARKVLGGIRDALAAGDIVLAAKVLWTGLQVAFLEGTKEIASKFADGLLIMKLTLVDVLGTMSQLWTRFSGGVQRVWEQTQNWLAKRITELMGLFDDSLDVEAAKKQLDEQSRARLESIAKETEDALKEISDEQADRHKSILDDAADKMDARRKELEEAKKKLDAQLAEARRKGDQARAEDAGGAAGTSLADRLRELNDMFGDIGAGLSRRIDVRGTFNALAVQGLAGGSNAAERTASATEQTARNTRRLVDASKSGGLTFA